MFIHQLLQHGIRLIVDKDAARLDHADKDAKLLEVIIEGREDIDMIPGDSRKDRDMRMKKMEFRPLFQYAGRILIAFADDYRRMSDIYRLRKALQPRPDQVVEVFPGRGQHRHDHGSSRRFSMATPDHDPPFINAFSINIFREGIHRQRQFERALQLGIVPFGVHPKDHRIEIGVDPPRFPAHLGRQQPLFLQICQRRFKDLVVASRHFISFAAQGNSQLMHHASTDRDKMNFHN